MEASFMQDLIQHLKTYLASDSQNTLWIGLAGAPGSGKSTLAAKLQAQFGDTLLVIPQDGYHYYRHQLDAMPEPAMAHARRGSPFTFDAERFVQELIQAKAKGTGVFPSFDHGAGDPIEQAIQLTDQHRIVLVEGSFVLLSDAPWCELKRQVFDESWFLNTNLEESCARVVKRHLQVGRTQEEAEHRMTSNDRLNAQLIIDQSVVNADRLID
jgi:pantothenate kinase